MTRAQQVRREKLPGWNILIDLDQENLIIQPLRIIGGTINDYLN